MFLHQLTNHSVLLWHEWTKLSLCVLLPIFFVCSVFRHGFSPFFVRIFMTHIKREQVDFFCNSSAVPVSSFRSFRMRVICQMNYKSCWLCTRSRKIQNHKPFLVCNRKKWQQQNFLDHCGTVLIHTHCCIWDNWTGETQITAIAAARQKV